MDKTPSLDTLRPELDRLIIETGAIAWGYTQAQEVGEEITVTFNRWLSAGYNAGMAYMGKYGEIRHDPRLLLEEGKSIISIAFSFHQNEIYPYLAEYAYGLDYHDVLRKRLAPVTQFLSESCGADSRICIDSAPIHERYWAVKCGLGSLCRNGALYVPGAGSELFLAEIITTLPAGGTWSSVETEKGEGCRGCSLCEKVCPGNAIGGEGIIDARRCINYLTIEHRGEWTAEQKEIMRKGGATIMGCDRCLRVCPLNKDIKGECLPEFELKDTLRNLTPEDFSEMSQEEFSRIFKGSPVKRAKLAGIKRNLGY